MCVQEEEGFVFRAEDGIRDYDVTGVQTCALPICKYGDSMGIGAAEVTEGYTWMYEVGGR